MSKSQDTVTLVITVQLIAELVDGVRRCTCGAFDKEHVVTVMTFTLTVHDCVFEPGASLRKLRRMLSSALDSSLDHAPSRNAGEEHEAPEIDAECESVGIDDAHQADDSSSLANRDLPLLTVPEPTPRSPRKQDQPIKGHGRLSSTAYTGAEVCQCRHPDLKVGDRCPDCGKGLLYRHDWRSQLQLRGHAPISAVRFEVEVLRCSTCKKTFSARNGAQAKYLPSVRSAIALNRYYLGMPFHRLERFQKLVGVPVPDATQWDLMEDLADTALPVFEQLVLLAAQSPLLHHDDTRIGILTLLDLRPKALPLPTQMSDAASANGKHGHQVIDARCNAHGVRKFKDIREQFPDACEQALQVMGQVYRHDHEARQANLTELARMEYHAAHSGPLLADFKTWMEQQLGSERQVEPNSGLGKAMRYLLKHWQQLTRFLQVPGVPLDNNIIERYLKLLTQQRRNSLFYRSERSA